MTKKNIVDELITDRRIEEFRENIGAGLRQLIEQPKARVVAARIYVKLAKRWALSPTEAATFIGIKS